MAGAGLPKLSKRIFMALFRLMCGYIDKVQATCQPLRQLEGLTSVDLLSSLAPALV